jgi:formate hydrogenlyase subunit 3/multisubunit Na+/H+ antiporter MnhD subunit
MEKQKPGMEKQKLGLGHFLILTVLFALLIVAVIWGSLVWTEGASVPMSGHGWVALSLGVVFSIVIGCGLMALMFYSSRSGYDDVATPKVLRDDAADDEAPPRIGSSPPTTSEQDRS